MANLELRSVLDGLGQGVLIFDTEGKLIMDNLTARTLLGTNIELIRKTGWEAIRTLFDTLQRDPDKLIDNIRDRALKSEKPVRFSTYLSGEYIPCWAAAVQGSEGSINLMLSIAPHDWSVLDDLFGYFRQEMTNTVKSTQGHIDIITQTIKHNDPDSGVETLTKRIGGFTRLISIHMDRTGRLMEMLERLQNIRTGQVRAELRERHRDVDLANFLEDFVEILDEITLVDPETDAHDHRSRISVEVPDGVKVSASSRYLTRILQDILRNAIMYSMKATPIKITVETKDHGVQISLVDEGYGIRESEREHIFEPFARAMQPQVIGEFGYGLSLYLCKQEVEAMNGRIWFESEEGVGTTFFVMLPAARKAEQSASASSSDT